MFLGDIDPACVKPRARALPIIPVPSTASFLSANMRAPFLALAAPLVVTINLAPAQVGSEQSAIQCGHCTPRSSLARRSYPCGQRSEKHKAPSPPYTCVGGYGSETELINRPNRLLRRLGNG